MRKLLNCLAVFVVILCAVLSFCACKEQKQNQSKAVDINLATAAEIESIDGFENFDDETVKSLALVIRSNFENFGSSGVSDSVKSKEPSIKNNEQMHKKIYSLVLLSESENNEPLKSKTIINITDNSSDFSQEIKKVDVLKFIAKNNISLSNISSIEPKFNDKNELEYLSVGGKKISYKDLKKEFGLNSNKIKSVDSTKNSLIICGEREYNDNDVPIMQIKEFVKRQKLGKLVEQNPQPLKELSDAAVNNF